MKTMTTIEITDEMVRETIKRVVQKWNESVGPDEPTLTPSDIFSEDVRDHLTAALPIIEKQMRAALEAPIRELCEGALAQASDSLASRMFDGSPFPAVVRAKDVLALLEGGGE